jgi:hypothetical protein
MCILQTCKTIVSFFAFLKMFEKDGTLLHARALFEIENLQRFYQSLFPALSEAYPSVFPAQLCTFERLVWIRCMFDTRAFELPWADSEESPDVSGISDDPLKGIYQPSVKLGQ